MNDPPKTPWKCPLTCSDILSEPVSQKKKEIIDPVVQTPTKSAKSKFVLPSRITPFPLSPKTPSKTEISPLEISLHSILQSNRATRLSRSFDVSSSPTTNKYNRFSSLDSEEHSVSESSEDEGIELLSSENVYPFPIWRSPIVNFLTPHDEISSKFFEGVMSNPVPKYVDVSFHFVRIVGSGSFSRVFLVKYHEDDCLYALKISAAPFIGLRDRYIYTTLF